MRQQLVDDVAVVLTVGGGIPVQVGGQQAPRLIGGAGGRKMHFFVLKYPSTTSCQVNIKKKRREESKVTTNLDSLVLTTVDS